MSTRADIRAMDESQLRIQVLVPLFRAMGFLDVTHYHGGAQEQGKDIVMWQRDDIRDRLNYAVVVKACAITGRASGTSSAAEVAFQVQQCFGRPYQDPVTLTDRNIDRCLVVSSQDIRKEATIAIGSALAGTQCEGRVDFINGNKLWELVERYLPEEEVLQKLSDARDIFERASDHHRIVAALDETGIALSVRPKHAGAGGAEPLPFKVTLAYPTTPEGEHALADLQRHFSTGAPVRIPHSFIKDVEIPELLRPYFKPNNGTLQIEIGPRMHPKPLLANIMVVPAQGSPARLEGIEFRVVQAGADEITLDNGQQGLPWHFTVCINFREQQFCMKYDVDMAKQNVKRELEGARLQTALAAGGLFSIEVVDTGLTFITGQIPAASTEAPSDDMLRFLEECLYIQTQTRTPLVLPSRPIPEDEVTAVYRLANILRHGKVNGTTDNVRLVLTRLGVDGLLAECAQTAKRNVVQTQQEVWTLLDAEIPLGKVITVVHDVTLRRARYEALQVQLATEPEREEFEVILEPAEEKARVTVTYADWLSAEEDGQQPSAAI